MARIVSTAAALAAFGAVLVEGSPAAIEKNPFPEVIQLPTGFRPEGIEVGRGATFYVGSASNGAIYRGNLRTGTGAILVPGAAGKAATGIELDRRNRLFVAGAGTGNAYVYDANGAALIRTYNLGTAPTFINDVVVTPDAAYFTDSQKNVCIAFRSGRAARSVTRRRSRSAVTTHMSPGRSTSTASTRRRTARLSSRSSRSTASCTASIQLPASRS
jgi:hypothetical protein